MENKIGPYGVRAATTATKGSRNKGRRPLLKLATLRRQRFISGTCPQPVNDSLVGDKTNYDDVLDNTIILPQEQHWIQMRITISFTMKITGTKKQKIISSEKKFF